MHKKTLIFLLLFNFSCSTTSIISSAIKNGQELTINVEQHKKAEHNTLNFYSAVVKKSGEVYTLHVTKENSTTIYKLPENKLTLLSEMESSFKDLHNNISVNYYLITARSAKRQKSYKVNTDIMNDFITGLKK